MTEVLTPGQFLRLIWPTTGFYCIGHPVKIPGLAHTPYKHHIFPTIGEAVTHCAEQAERQDVFFAILSLREEKVWNPEKVDYKTGEKGAYSTRIGHNMLAARCLFWDLDVGTEDHKYSSQGAALQALMDFCITVGLPKPVLTSSGGGIHVYWPFDADHPVDEWRTLAFRLRQLGEALGLKMDPTRTLDVTSVLRVPGTKNWKDKQSPRAVTVLQTAPTTPVAQIARAIDDALIRAGQTPGEAPDKFVPTPVDPVFGEQKFNDFGPPPTLDDVMTACANIRQTVLSQVDPAQYVDLDNGAWYRGLIGLISHVEDGDNWCRKLTDLHPRDNADIEAKLLQQKAFPPARCTTLQQYMPWKDAPCQTCRFKNDPSVPNPLAAARKGVSAAPPALAPAGGAAGPAAPTTPSAVSGSTPPPPPSALLMTPSPQVLSIMLPNPPRPYERMKSGGVSITKTDKDGNVSTSVILSHDLYPVKRLVNSESVGEQQVWRATLPRVGTREFTIDADTLYDGRKFTAALSNNGVYPNKADIPALQDYMVAYISQLQKDLDADSQTTHLGWTDDYRQFVLPDITLHSDGTVKASALTTGAQNAVQFIASKGDLTTQVKLLEFYNRDEYMANQFAILCGLASIIFHATGQHGVVVNMSGESGASKSTTLYVMSSLWGNPALWPINGTGGGATPKARAQRVQTNANLPTPVDEITHIPVKEAQDLVMNVTQPGHRLRLQTDGSERKVTDNYKSAIMVSTANSSLHNLLSQDNVAGTAGSMRVFEMKMMAQGVHTKAEADEFLRQIKENFGHIGPVFARFVVMNLAAIEARVQAVVREIDTAAVTSSAERFWSAVIAVVLVAGDIGKTLGITPYDIVKLQDWAVTKQIPYMRGVIREEYRDPLAVLSDYIAEKHGNIVVINKSTGIGTNTGGAHVPVDNAYAVNKPVGALLGHYDMNAGVLYLLKNAFRDHCNRVGASSSRIIEELHQLRGGDAVRPPTRIVTERSVRRTLGAGTDLAKGQSWVFAVDMKHPDVSGVVPLTTVTNSAPATSAPAGQLKAV